MNYICKLLAHISIVASLLITLRLALQVHTLYMCSSCTRHASRHRAGARRMINHIRSSPLNSGIISYSPPLCKAHHLPYKMHESCPISYFDIYMVFVFIQLHVHVKRSSTFTMSLLCSVHM